MKSTRSLRNEILRQNHAFVGKLSARLESIPAAEINEAGELQGVPEALRPVMIWRSRTYMVQLYQEGTAEFPIMLRLSICRTKLRPDGRWEDGLTWDEMNAIKEELGYGGWYGVEVFPPTADIQNLNNYRHLWLLPTALPIGFKKRN